MKKANTYFVSIHAPAWGATLKPAVTLGMPEVSIHAPAWGATSSSMVASCYANVSIHAPAWGATGFFGFCFSIASCFNPRTRVGCDVFQCALQLGVIVSIHAPAWGATPSYKQVMEYLIVSIHAPAWGATLTTGQTAPQERKFQSTHPRGVRPLMFLSYPFYDSVSIHAPAWGATDSSDAIYAYALSVSIHAPAWGATQRET